MPQEILPPFRLDRDEELAELHAEMAAISGSIDLDEERERCEGSFIDFFKGAWPEIDPAPFSLNWHHYCIAEHLEAVRTGEILKLLVNIPPRFGKTSLITVCYPAWLWVQQEIDFLSGPQTSFLCASYGEKPVYRQANAARRLLMGVWYKKLWGHRVRIIKDGLDELQNSAGGYRISSSLGGAILGAGANLRILDDPQSTEMAVSEIERERTTRLFSEGLTTRRTDPRRSAIIVVMQRLHEGDISGWILENELDEWTHVCLPQRFDPRRYIQSVYFSDPRTEDGELLWPEQHPKELVDADERTMGPVAFSGQMQQTPTPRGGNIIQRDWWRLWPDDAPEFADQSSICQCPHCGWRGPVEGTAPEAGCQRCYRPAERVVVFPEFSFRVLSVDTNFGEKERNAYSAATVWGIWHAKDDQPRAMLCAAWRGRPPLRTDPQNPREMGLVERFHSIAARHQVDCILIEQRTRGWDLYNELAKETQEWPYRLQYFNPIGRGDKVARLHATQALFTNDLVWAPNKSWADMTIQEVVTAPSGRYWDLSDTCLVSGTRIATDRGDVPIELVRVGDRVVTPLGWRRVSASGCTGKSEVVSMGGLTGTSSHPVFSYAGWLSLDTMSTHHMLTSRLTLCGLIRLTLLSLWNSKVSSIASWEPENIISAISERGCRRIHRGAGTKACTLRSGKATTASLSLLTMRLIILTVTRLIAVLTTWSAYRLASIGRAPKGAIRNRSSTVWKRPALWRRSGTARKWVEHGIASTRLNPCMAPVIRARTRAAAVFRAAADGAARNLWPTTHNAFIAAAPANPVIRDIRWANKSSFTLTLPNKMESRKKNYLDRAKSAERSSGSAETRDSVPGRVASPPIARVYNLSVEDAECYYANGVLVHNCAQALLYLRHDLQLLKLPDEYKREQIRERLVEARTQRSNVRELIEG